MGVPNLVSINIAAVIAIGPTLAPPPIRIDRFSASQLGRHGNINAAAIIHESHDVMSLMRVMRVIQIIPNERMPLFVCSILILFRRI